MNIYRYFWLGVLWCYMLCVWMFQSSLFSAFVCFDFYSIPDNFGGAVIYSQSVIIGFCLTHKSIVQTAVFSVSISHKSIHHWASIFHSIYTNNSLSLIVYVCVFFLFSIKMKLHSAMIQPYRKSYINEYLSGILRKCIFVNTSIRIPLPLLMKMKPKNFIEKSSKPLPK